jgi:hypothetical protein
MKRFISGVMALGLLACVSAASASNAGTSSDPLITKSYIEDTYIPNVVSAGEAVINQRISQLSGSVDKAESYDMASGYEAYILPTGESVEIITGSSVILTGGSAKIASLSGTIVNVTTGQEVTAGTSLTLNNRYFCAEDTVAIVTASTGASVAVNGYYNVSAGAEKPVIQYDDVAVNAWYYSAAEYVYKNELFHDYNSSSFKPGEAATRAELVYALWKASGSPETSTSATFSDLTEEWYKKAANWASANGIILGYDNNRFAPNNSITRQEIAVVMYRYTAYRGYSVSKTTSLSGFTDATSIASWAETAMKWANAEGMIVGTSNTTLSPKGTASRSEVATIVMRFMESH